LCSACSKNLGSAWVLGLCFYFVKVVSIVEHAFSFTSALALDINSA
jgi:hypothetical protein